MGAKGSIEPSLAAGMLEMLGPLSLLGVSPTALRQCGYALNKLVSWISGGIALVMVNGFASIIALFNKLRDFFRQKNCSEKGKIINHIGGIMGFV